MQHDIHSWYSNEWTITTTLSFICPEVGREFVQLFDGGLYHCVHLILHTCHKDTSNRVQALSVQATMILMCSCWDLKKRGLYSLHLYIFITTIFTFIIVFWFKSKYISYFLRTDPHRDHWDSHWSVHILANIILSSKNKLKWGLICYILLERSSEMSIL